MKKLIYTLPLLLALGACSSEEVTSPDLPTTPVTSGGYYLSFTVETTASNASTRNTTQSSGDSDEEVTAAENENKLETAKIYFLDSDNKVLIDPIEVSTSNYVETGNSTTPDTGVDETLQITVDGTDKTKHKLVYKIQDMTELAKFVPLCTKDAVYVVIVGNEGASYSKLTNPLSSTSGSDDAKAAYFTASTTDVIQNFGDLAAGKIMPLVSYDSKKVTTFASASNVYELVDLFTGTYTPTSGKELQIKGSDTNSGSDVETTIVTLERAVARIDFTYRDESARESELGATLKGNKYLYKLGTSNALINICKIEVFNVAQTSNLFRQTRNGDATNAYADGSSVTLFGKEKGSDAEKYNWVTSYDWPSNGAFTSRNLLNPYSATETTIEYLYKDPSTFAAAAYQNGYYPWIYVPENTIPSTTLMSETNLQSYATGIKFKFMVMEIDGTTPAKATSSATNLPAGVTIVGTDNKQLRIMMEDGHYQIFDFDTTDGNCYMTYIGFLKHHNPDDSGLSPMEYGVVRNNVYQCKVTGVSNLLTPEDPYSLYLTLEVQVKKWQKRTNDFQF